MRSPLRKQHVKKLRFNVETVQDVWESLAKPKYPTLNTLQLSELKYRASIDWFQDRDTELNKLFDQYVMMKNLLDISY